VAAIVADTSAVLALMDRGDKDHPALRMLYEERAADWILPWAILPEVDYVAGKKLGFAASQSWIDNLAAGAMHVEWGKGADLLRAQKLCAAYASLEIGLVDAVVMSVAERLRADIATLDLRHFAAVRLVHTPRLLPRDVHMPARRGHGPE
jgi:predicted nucleic acid-binding protein